METTETIRTGRLIGLQHRRKKTKAGEARPTILKRKDSDGTIVTHELEDDLAELDFVHGFFPVSWRPVTVGENFRDVIGKREHHIRFRDPAENETLQSVLALWPRESLKIETKGRGAAKREILIGIPTETAENFDGLKAGDKVVGIFGGSGYNLVIALINKAVEIGAQVFLTSPRHLKTARDAAFQEKSEDAELLVRMFEASPDLFHEILPTDVVTWETMHAWDLTDDAMQQRKKVIQRAEAAATHQVYVSNKYIGSELAQKVLDAKMGDTTVQDVIESEEAAQTALEAAIEKHPLFNYLFGDIKGCGPRLFGKVLSAVRDIRRFPRPHKNGKGVGAFLRFTGYAIDKVNGRCTIQRFRRGGGMPGNPEIKQAIWLLVDMQFSRQKDTPWGLRFRELKAAAQAKHPVPELVCDTEIPLKEGKYEARDGGWTVVFAEGKDGTVKSHFYPAGEVVGEWEPGMGSRKNLKLLKVPAETIALQKDWEWEVSNGLYTIKKPDGTVEYRPGKSQYTKAHIHKIAGWKLGTEFVVWLLWRWYEYVDGQAAARQAGNQQAA